MKVVVVPPFAITTRSLSAASNLPNGHPGPGPVNTATVSKNGLSNVI